MNERPRKAPIAVRAARAAAALPTFRMEMRPKPREWRDRLGDRRTLESMRHEHARLVDAELHDGWGACRCILARVIREIIKTPGPMLGTEDLTR